MNFVDQLHLQITPPTYHSKSARHGIHTTRNLPIIRSALIHRSAPENNPTMTTQFHLPSPTPSQSPTSTPQHSFSPANIDSDSDESSLPYPPELQRSAFLAEDFDPQTYLATLRNRHQTLEDLRSDLRQRSQLLNKELLDLVNGNYEEFLSLGAGLKGGEEMVEGVRVGVLGFGREVEGLRGVVGERQGEVLGLVGERMGFRGEVGFGRGVLELVERVEELEGDGVGGEDVDEEDEDEEEGCAATVLAKKLRRRTGGYELIIRLRDRICASHATSAEHPLIVSLRPRIVELRRLLLLDLSSALRQAKTMDDSSAVLEIMSCFSLLGAHTGRARDVGNG